MRVSQFESESKSDTEWYSTVPHTGSPLTKAPRMLTLLVRQNASYVSLLPTTSQLPSVIVMYGPLLVGDRGAKGPVVVVKPSVAAADMYGCVIVLHGYVAVGLAVM